MHSAHSARFPGEGTSTRKGSREAALLGWMFGKSPPAWGVAGKLGWVLLGCLGIFKELLNGPKLGLAELPGPLLPPCYPGCRSLLGAEAVGCLWVSPAPTTWTPRCFSAPAPPASTRRCPELLRPWGCSSTVFNYRSLCLLSCSSGVGAVPWPCGLSSGLLQPSCSSPAVQLHGAVLPRSVLLWQPCCC